MNEDFFHFCTRFNRVYCEFRVRFDALDELLWRVSKTPADSRTGRSINLSGGVADRLEALSWSEGNPENKPNRGGVKGVIAESPDRMQIKLLASIEKCEETETSSFHNAEHDRVSFSDKSGLNGPSGRIPRWFYVLWFYWKGWESPLWWKVYTFFLLFAVIDLSQRFEFHFINCSRFLMPTFFQPDVVKFRHF